MNKVPILVGVIGHRNLIPEQIPEIELKVKAVLTSLKSKYKDTPLFVVTSLAEGADFLGAKVAADLGIHLISLLPMPVEEYKTHFDDEGNAAMLETYVKSSMISHVCEPVTGKPGSDDDKFARSGAAVMQYSHIVIALWDGDWTDRDSGTSFLIKHAIAGIPSKIIFELEGDFASPLDPISTASIRRIPVDRVSNSLVVDPVFPAELVFGPDKYSEIEFKKNHRVAKLKIGDTQKKMFQRFDDYNRDQLRFHPKSGSWADSSSYPPLVPNESLQLLPPGLVTLRERFAIADRLAVHFQKKRHHLFANFIIVLAAFTTFFHQIINSEHTIEHWIKIPELWDNLPYLKFLKLGESWPFLIYGFLIVLGTVTVMFVRWRKWQQRYLDYRTIAEGIRIQFFWLIGGIRCPAVNYFLRKQLEDLEWIRGVLRLWYLRAITDQGWVADANREQATLIQTHWIEDQLNHSKTHSQRFSKKDKFLKFGWGFLICVLFGSMVMKTQNLPETSVLQFQFGEIVDVDISWDHFYSLIGALAGALIIFISSIRYFFNYRDLAKARGQMAVLFADGKKVYDPSNGIQSEERDVLKELGRESLAEVGDWLLMNRKRKVKLPK